MYENVVTTDAINWQAEVLESKKLVVVMFWHQQCPYCRVLEPVYEELSREYSGKLKFTRFNVLESPENETLAANYGVMGTPTLMFFCQGRPVQDFVGALTKDYVQQGIEFALKKHQECANQSTPLHLPYIS
ncbi:MAG TPA: thioredoxin domain-containing protein [Candidatus Krumholzibacteriaceae bacterium]|jgi:thioredoxin 1|nr:thioredoxin domain-containing protein [Candidatus Krumholzibacteriaceae bacterium]